TTDLSNFNFGNGWLLYVPFNGPVESWTIEPPSNPTKSAQLITTHGPWFRGFGESLFTKKKYDNYKLTLEMFMPAGGGNSGIYLRDAWEIQLGSGVPDISHNGDAVYVQNGAIYDMEPMLRTYIPIAGTDPEDDSQWNLIEITVVDQTVSLTMGGIVMQLQSIPPLGNAIATATQNAGRSFQNNPHPVGLQNHTGEVRFRNMVITPIHSLCERDVKPCKKHHK
ncbi:MAG: DUF1080 domain-containing protein, partial [Verrucomicrobia bacterium]|nr:DUF1080 domain-containing protein [Verrucomicrobiota bacterium]